MEALIRLRGTDGSLRPPGSCIPVAGRRRLFHRFLEQADLLCGKAHEGGQGFLFSRIAVDVLLNGTVDAGGAFPQSAR